jgi:hypothetical protein
MARPFWLPALDSVINEGASGDVDENKGDPFEVVGFQAEDCNFEDHTAARKRVPGMAILVCTSGVPGLRSQK